MVKSGRLERFAAAHAHHPRNRRQGMMEPMSDNESITVVIPVYNSASTLETLLCRVRATLEPLGRSYEVILVDDGSHDGSWQRILTLRAHYPQILGIRLMRNYGQHNALLSGIRAAHHDIVITMDDDLQNPPEEIPRLLAKLGEGYDVVYGTPARAEHGLWRNLASRVTKLVLQGSMGAETARSISAFRAFRTSLRAAFATYQSPFVSIDVLLTWGTKSFAAVPVRHDPRREQRSNYTFRKLVTHAFSMITGFSTLPLQIASLVGFAFTFFGIAVLVYVIGRYLLNGGSVAGFAFLASIIAIFSGAQLFALGIIGEYLARMHFRMMERPVYVVREDSSNERS
jgi:undecaprenyl-phosphate 4-deoxy-4-formamido-L-arabinose transferase